jgi:O-antigen/teichoic acid export membrane protein
VLGGAAVNVAGNLILIPRLGMSGAGVTTMVSEGLVLALTWRLLGRKTLKVAAPVLA